MPGRGAILFGLSFILAVTGGPACAGQDKVGQDGESAETMVARSKKLYSAPEPRCDAGPADQILVCGRQAGDLFRIPSSGPVAGAPETATVMEERRQLLHPGSDCDNVGGKPCGGGVVPLSGIALWLVQKLTGEEPQ